MENTVNLKSSIAWSDFKLNSDGMVPVIAQDYQTNEVLMLAYMNEEAFNTTLETGKMTYWSRSRNELWTKGLTSVPSKSSSPSATPYSVSSPLKYQ